MQAPTPGPALIRVLLRTRGTSTSLRRCTIFNVHFPLREQQLLTNASVRSPPAITAQYTPRPSESTRSRTISCGVRAAPTLTSGFSLDARDCFVSLCLFASTCALQPPSRGLPAHIILQHAIRVGPCAVTVFSPHSPTSACPSTFRDGSSDAAPMRDTCALARQFF
jgi:hypothetical protein